MRLIICQTCAAIPRNKVLHPDDAANGFKWRRVEIAHVKKPPCHRITINDVPQPEMKTLHCDDCGQPIQDGDPATAISQWRGGGMGPWEKEYTQ